MGSAAGPYRLCPPDVSSVYGWWLGIRSNIRLMEVQGRSKLDALRLRVWVGHGATAWHRPVWPFALRPSPSSDCSVAPVPLPVSSRPFSPFIYLGSRILCIPPPRFPLCLWKHAPLTRLQPFLVFLAPLLPPTLRITSTLVIVASFVLSYRHQFSALDTTGPARGAFRLA